MNQPGGTRGSDGWAARSGLVRLVPPGRIRGRLCRRRPLARVDHQGRGRLGADRRRRDIGGALRLAPFGPGRRSPRGPAQEPTGIEGPRGQSPGGRRPDPSIRPAPDQVAVVRLMEPQEPVTKSWWNHGEPTSAAGAAAAAEAPVTPDLSSYLDSALVAQCPNCGSFRMDTDQTAPEWRFRCQECQQIWAWRPGESLARDPGSAALAQETIGEIRCIRNRSAVRDQAA